MRTPKCRIHVAFFSSFAPDSWFLEFNLLNSCNQKVITFKLWCTSKNLVKQFVVVSIIEAQFRKIQFVMYLCIGFMEIYKNLGYFYIISTINMFNAKIESKRIFRLGMAHSRALHLCCCCCRFFFHFSSFYAIYVMKQLHGEQQAINLGAKEKHFQTWNVQIKYWLESHCCNGMRLTLQMQILLPIRMQRGKIVNFIWRSKSEIQWLWKNPGNTFIWRLKKFYRLCCCCYYYYYCMISVLRQYKACVLWQILVRTLFFVDCALAIVMLCVVKCKSNAYLSVDVSRKMFNFMTE